MSRSVTRSMLVSSAAILAALVFLPAASFGQAAPESEAATRERLMQRIGELIPVEEAASREAAAVRARLEEQERLANATAVDSLNVGGILVLSLPEQSDVAREIFTRAWSHYPGYAGSPALADVAVTFQWTAGEFRPIYVDDLDEMGVQHRRWRTRSYVERSA